MLFCFDGGNLCIGECVVFNVCDIVVIVNVFGIFYVEFIVCVEDVVCWK